MVSLRTGFRTKQALVVVALGLLATPACAQADWRKAGGGLFVETQGDVEAQAAGAGALRLPTLAQPFSGPVGLAAERHGLDPKLLHALVIVESGYRANAVSRAGAAGLTQLMPATARGLGVEDRFAPASSLDGGAAYLAQQLLRFGDLKLALAAYNAGPERVARVGRVPEIRETKLYVEAVIECFLALSAGRGATTASACRAEAAP